MSTAMEEQSPDPDLIAAIWHKRDEFRAKRVELAEVETELLLLLIKLESLNLSILEILKICNEPLLISIILKKTRYAEENSPDKRSITEIYANVNLISREVEKERRGWESGQGE